jgi:hypothetical protein
MRTTVKAIKRCTHGLSSLVVGYLRALNTRASIKWRGVEGSTNLTLVMGSMVRWLEVVRPQNDRASFPDERRLLVLQNSPCID